MAPGQRRAQADDTPDASRSGHFRRSQRQQSAQAVRHHVQPGLSAQGLDQPRHHRIGVLQQAVVAELARREALAAQSRGQPAHGDAAHPQPMHQQHAIAHAGRGNRR